MSRLPVTGGDDGTWGSILNDFLSQAHDSSGSLKPITQDKIAGLSNDLDDKVDTTDVRLTDNRTPTDASVTAGKIATPAAPSSGQFLRYSGSQVEWTTVTPSGANVDDTFQIVPQNSNGTWQTFTRNGSRQVLFIRTVGGSSSPSTMQADDLMLQAVLT